MKFDLYYYLDNLYKDKNIANYMTILLHDIFKLENKTISNKDGDILFKEKNGEENKEYVFCEEDNVCGAIFNYIYSSGSQKVEFFLSKNKIKYVYLNNESIYSFSVPNIGEPIIKYQKYDCESYKYYKQMKRVQEEALYPFLIDRVNDLAKFGFFPDEEYEAHIVDVIQFASIFNSLLLSPIKYASEYGEQIKSANGECLILKS